MKPIAEVAGTLSIGPDELISYGRYKAKIPLSIEDRFKNLPKGKYVALTAITPTPFGEGKTTTAIGLTEALGSVFNKKAVCCLRQPSMGPTFNIKGGAAGGGKSRIIPEDDFNLHLTGDVHAAGAAHNLVAAAIDSRLYHESRQSDASLSFHGVKRLDIDPETIVWRRVLDVCDRSLREIEIGLNDHLLKDGSPSLAFPRRSAFDITEASELMALLALSESLEDLRKRVGRVMVAFDRKGRLVTLEDLGVAGAVTVILKDALQPNLMQTTEGQPVFIHCGPFANIAHGNSSIIADRMALGLADYVVTEGGFGSDIGLEKFFNIKCRASGLLPDVVVLVATVRALKLQGGGPPVKPGQALPDAYSSENLSLLEAGLENLAAHMGIVKRFGVPLVVAVNRFASDSGEEIDRVCRYAIEKRAAAAVPTDHFEKGGEGAATLAEAVMSACELPSEGKPLYPDDWPIKKKIDIIAREIYGAEGVDFMPEAEKAIENFERLGFDHLPICMAKSPYSLSHDPALKGAPKGFVLPVKEVRVSAGAGFIYALAGEINTMPGMATHPAFMHVDIDVKTGKVKGLY